MPFADLPDVRLFYTVDGPRETPGDAARDTANTLLLVHGWGSDSHEWVQHIPQLAATYRVIAPDLRGHGYSGTARTGTTPRTMADDLRILLERLRADRVVAIGHSMGGQIVGHLADTPDLVTALVTVDPAYGFGPQLADSFPRIARELAGPRGTEAAIALDAWTSTPATPRWIRAWHARRLLAAPQQVLAEAFAAMFTAPDAIGPRPAAEDHLRHRSQPTLCFRFDRDLAAWERPLLSHPGSRVVCWPDSGHRLHEEHPEEFLLVLTRWLDETVRTVQPEER
ncbi:alpha/beta hydrolase [Nocardiopsis gilva YIM 90087]|uniref:Alpha/beta hydrolase n=1 Tax=Nocardiopsis gilva YIM 90087 TaxID=1235441 RepID=A0A223S4A6_9ACTN|nr:alpha/beta hydrolase [Nocardiopsis gilva]ASU82970.1 alpha/beta hydrolase [Nocardiopsis gilva YIM 90087]